MTVNRAPRKVGNCGFFFLSEKAYAVTTHKSLFDKTLLKRATIDDDTDVIDEYRKIFLNYPSLPFLSGALGTCKFLRMHRNCVIYKLMMKKFFISMMNMITLFNTESYALKQ